MHLRMFDGWLQQPLTSKMFLKCGTLNAIPATESSRDTQTLTIPMLGTTVVPFCPLYFGASLLRLNSRKKGTLIIYGLLGNLVCTPRVATDISSW